MKRIAKFEKVSEEIFINSGYTKEEYEEYSLPLRATAGSAGYDFFAVREFTLNPHETITVPTGVRAKIADGWVLKIYPRSSLGFKYRFTLDNTVGIIDGDYYYSDNEGHIFVRATNLGEKPFTVKKGQGFCQGIFSEYGITEDDNATNVRNGGFGSTDNKTR
ncbi:MAG TPA: deoxyuridine 5'-triphosphate nucleotidohydrolase [Clostridiales bacterium]|mgnify:FL=1|nr:deoxyuridine 5'-triphosphate nucleotidohydrolase [Clostridiales bacterium]